MPHRLRIAAFAFGLGLVAGCFRQAPTPPDFRFECVSDDECVALLDDNGDPMLDMSGDPYAEKCINGLCQFPCGGSLFDLFDQKADNGCPPDNSYTCFNGICSNLCDATKDPTTCSAPQKCLEFTSFEAFASIDGVDAFLMNFTIEHPGLCGLRCDDADAPDCPEGQACVSGVCLDLSGFGTTGTTGTTTDGTTDASATDTDATTGSTGP